MYFFLSWKMMRKSCTRLLARFGRRLALLVVADGQAGGGIEGLCEGRRVRGLQVAEKPKLPGRRLPLAAIDIRWPCHTNTVTQVQAPEASRRRNRLLLSR